MAEATRQAGMDDLALIRRAQEGDSTAFSELLDLYYDTIHRFAWKWCGHAANADDIAQLACLKLANSLAQFRFQAAFTSWLYRLVISCAQDWQRSQGRHDHDELPAEEGALAGVAPHHDATEESIYLVQLLSLLETLGEGMKETALLVHGEGLSHAEAGAILGVTESTISWRVHAIRKHLHRIEILPAKRGSGS